MKKKKKKTENNLDLNLKSRNVFFPLNFALNKAVKPKTVFVLAYQVNIE